MSSATLVVDGDVPSQSFKVLPPQVTDKSPDTPGIIVSQNGVISSKQEGKPGKKFHNGWTTELETLATEWSDNAACYQWMHDRSRQIQSTNNLRMKIPAIILSTVTGTASFGLSSLFGGNDSSKTIAQMVIGSISIFVGVIGTLDTFFQYAQSSEIHSTAAVNWGNFQRNIEFQMKLHPNERIDAMAFLKMMQNEMNRLIEQSPPILNCVLKEFQIKFDKNVELKKPAIANGLEHTTAHLLQEETPSINHDSIMQEVEKRIKELIEVNKHPSGESTPPTIVIRDS